MLKIPSVPEITPADKRATLRQLKEVAKSKGVQIFRERSPRGYSLSTLATGEPVGGIAYTLAGLARDLRTLSPANVRWIDRNAWREYATGN